MMDRKRIYLSSPTMHGEEQKYVQEAFDTNWVAPLGPNVNAFEQEIAAYTGSGHAAALSAGTAAIHMALKLLRVERGDVVFVSDLTFSASCNPIIYEHGTPVFIDSEPDTWNMSPQALRRAFEKYPHPKAVICVHLYGTPAKLDEIMAICEEHQVPLVEDAATSGGGMFVSAEEEAAKRVTFFATQSRDPARHYQHSEIGYNYRMSNVTAGIGRGQLLHLEEHKKRKQEIYRQYQAAFADVPEISMNPDGDANCWLSGMLIAKESKVTPDMVMDALEEINAESRPIWKPMHMQPVFAGEDFMPHYEDGRSVGEDVFARGLCLPSDIKNTDEDMELIIRTVRECFAGYV